MHRRDFFKTSAGAAAMWQAAKLSGGRLLAAERTHHEPKAKRLLFIFLTGGFSHVDTFDPKPELLAHNREIVSAESLRDVTKAPLLASPFKFARHGQSGLEISALFPHLATVADELCVIRTLHTDILEHFQAVLAMHTGSATVPLPSLGAWLSYGLGSQNENLPPYVVLCEHLPYAGAQVWDSNFLPAEHQGTRVIPGPTPIDNLAPPAGSPAPSLRMKELEAQLLDDINREHASRRELASDLRASMQSLRTARGMLAAAPEAFDVSGETATTIADYGLEAGGQDKRSFGWQCLIARRLLERGVRTVELIDSGAGDNWDSHGDMQAHRPKAARVDRPIAALIADLKRRGLLAETLVAICTEFGRTPWDPGPGRNHWHRAFSSLLCGAGVRGGLVYGKTDDFGILPVENAVHVHDYHATILHLLGIDHTRLTYRYAGRDFRLTDVHGRVLSGILV